MFMQNALFLDSAYNLIQAAATTGAEKNIWFSQKFDKGTNAFFTLDVASLLWTGAILAGTVKENFWVESTYAFPAVLIANTLVSIVALGAFALLSGLWVQKLNSIYTPTDNVIDEHCQTQYLKWDRPFQEKLKQWLFVSRIGVNVALSISTGEFSFALNGALQAFSLRKIAEKKWLCYTKSTTSVEQSIEKIKAKYFFQVNVAKPQDECSVCYDPSPDIHFCEDHVFHLKCIDTQLKLWEIQLNESNLQSVGNNEYKVKLQPEQLPSCPSCRKPPIHSAITFDVKIRAPSY